MLEAASELHRKKLDKLGYETVRQLDEGGMGIIYEVLHRDLKKRRVAKVMKPHVAEDPEFRNRFLEEAKKLSDVIHTNIAVLYDYKGDDEGFAVIIMEFIDGVTLADVITTGESPSVPSPPSVPMTVEIAHQALEAIDCLHRHGWVHRDISPDNLMLTKGSQGLLVKLIDLGIAKDLGRLTHATGTGVFMGKPMYASPEQISRSSHELTAATDIYSFGVVLYQLLTGRMPVRGASSAEIGMTHTSRPPIPFEQTDPQGRVPTGLRALVLRALEKDPSRRPGSAAEFLDSLRPFRAPRDISPNELDQLLERARSRKGSEQARTRGGSTRESTGEWEYRLNDKAKAHEAAGEYGKAIRVLEDVLVVLPGDQAIQRRIQGIRRKIDEDHRVQKLTREGQAFVAEGKLPEARRQLEDARALSAGHPRVRHLAAEITTAEIVECGKWLETARKHLEGESYDQAFKDVECALGYRPDDRAAHDLRQKIHMAREGRARELTFEVRRALDNALAAVDIPTRKEHLGAAGAVLEGLKAIYPGYTDVPELENEIERVEEAIRTSEIGEELARRLDSLRAIVEQGEFIDPSDAQAVSGWQGESERAMSELRAIANDRPDYGEVRDLLGRFQSIRTRLAEAVQEIERSEVEGRLETASRLVDQRRYREAARLLRPVKVEVRSAEALKDLRPRVAQLSRAIRRDRMHRVARGGILAAAIVFVGAVVTVWWQNRSEFVRLRRMPQRTQEQISVKRAAVRKLMSEDGRDSDRYTLLSRLDEVLRLAEHLDRLNAGELTDDRDAVVGLAELDWQLLDKQLETIEDFKIVDDLRQAAHEDLCGLRARFDSEGLRGMLARQGIDCR